MDELSKSISRLSRCLRAWKRRDLGMYRLIDCQTVADCRIVPDLCRPGLFCTFLVPLTVIIPLSEGGEGLSLAPWFLVVETPLKFLMLAVWVQGHALFYLKTRIFAIQFFGSFALALISRPVLQRRLGKLLRYTWTSNCMIFNKLRECAWWCISINCLGTLAEVYSLRPRDLISRASLVLVSSEALGRSMSWRSSVAWRTGQVYRVYM